MFNFAILNPLRMIDTSDINNGFDGDFAVRQLQSYQNKKSYFQPWNYADTIKLQVLSDFVPTDLVFKDVYSDAEVGSVAWAEVPTVIVGHTFKVYELEYPVINLPFGKFYATFEYVDEDLLTHVLMSEPISVQVAYPNTLLLKYKNSTNDFDVIFETGIEFEFRVESAVKDFVPGNNFDNIYEDQPVNPTLLSATPYRKFKFYLGFQYGLPEWVFDKVNYIQSVDQVRYNNVYYQIIKGSEYEIERNTDNSYIGGSIDVRATENNFARYITETIIDEDNIFSPMQRKLEFKNVAADFSIAGKFDAFSLLEKIVVLKRSVGPINMLVGTSLAGDEIGDFEIDADANDFTQTIDQKLSGTTTLYLTGFNGTDCDVWIIYKKLNAEDIDLSNIGGDQEPLEWPIGTTVIYDEVTEGDFAVNFDETTGLGRPNTPWAKWAMRDGRNGTVNSDGFALVGVNPNDAKFDSPNKTHGTPGTVLTTGQLPNFQVKANVGHRLKDVAGGAIMLSLSPVGANGQSTLLNIGSNEAHSNYQPSQAVRLVTKIS